MKISKRLQKIAEMVKYPAMVDIGTDHGLLPIYMARQGMVGCALATDVNPGPLERAMENIAAAGLAGCVKVQLCDGLEGVCPQKYETCVIAGMGGGLIIDILQRNLEAAHGFKQIIASPQRDVADVRRFLHQSGFCINDEDIIEEKGKFYNILDISSGIEEAYDEKGYVFGKILLQKKSDTMKRYVGAEVEKVRKIGRGELEGYLQLCLEVMGCL
ncbi:MAG: class I SAM-dependent methyltransferase [Defluviitaleaceae bacterium]|nr:class I SAM-dependent methyltransferase [Defluviitaleaceae bacterium]